MKYLITLLLLSTGFTLAAQQTIINDKNAEVRNVSGFSSIKVSGAIDVYLSQSNSEAVAVSASENSYREKIKTEVTNGVLNIYYDGDRMGWSISHKNLRAYISFKQLEALEATGASSFKINGIASSASLKITLTGASSIEGNIKISDLNIHATGASIAKFSGEATNVKIDATGASDVKGYELAVENCNVKVTGASDVHLTINKELSANATGASTVLYKGDAVIKDIHATGASTISKKS